MYLDRLDVRFRLNVIIFMHVYFVFVYLQSNFMVVFFPSLLCEGISLKHNNAPTLLFFHWSANTFCSAHLIVYIYIAFEKNEQTIINENQELNLVFKKL